MSFLFAVSLMKAVGTDSADKSQLQLTLILNEMDITSAKSTETVFNNHVAHVQSIPGNIKTQLALSSTHRIRRYYPPVSLSRNSSAYF